MGDFHATLRFYRDVLGWSIKACGGRKAGQWLEFEGDPPAGVVPSMLTVAMADGSYLAFVTDKAPDYAGDEPHIAVSLPNEVERDALRKRLQASHIALEENPGENFAFYDPSGLRVEVY